MSVIEKLKPSQLQGLPPIPKVEDIESWEDTDSLGDRALRVQVVLASETPDADRRWRNLEPIQNAIERLLEQEGYEHFPYVRFLTRSELEEERKQR